MEKQLKYWIEFFAPGSFTANTWTKDVECLPDPNSVTWPDNAYSFTLNKREDVIDGDNTYKGKVEQVGPMYYHPDSTITTLAQVKAGETPGSIGHALVGNMDCNNWDAVVWTRWGNWPQPFDAAKHQVCRAV